MGENDDEEQQLEAEIQLYENELSKWQNQVQILKERKQQRRDLNSMPNRQERDARQLDRSKLKMEAESEASKTPTSMRQRTEMNASDNAQNLGEN